ncbi:MAG TPA: hypothetical protein DDW52_10440 [Planctomycetaceae bacterium]|nr:hypothetical protein [Planctomycetaceae bacterium]
MMILLTLLGERWKFLFTPFRKASSYCDPRVQTGKPAVVDSRLHSGHRLESKAEKGELRGERELR